MGDHDDIDVVLAVLADTSARQWAEERAHAYLGTALLSLRSTSIAEPAADELETLAYELTLQ